MTQNSFGKGKRREVMLLTEVQEALDTRVICGGCGGGEARCTEALDVAIQLTQFQSGNWRMNQREITLGESICHNILYARDGVAENVNWK